MIKTREYEVPDYKAEKDGKELDIYQEIDTFEDDDNPRDYGLGKMYCWHSEYSLGDENPYKKPSDLEASDEFKNAVIKESLFLFDHSGITIKIGSFGNDMYARFDSGQVGYIIATKEDILKFYKSDKLTDSLKEKAHKEIEDEVSIYTLYMQGRIYRYELVDITTKEELDSCSGFYGEDFKNNGMADMIKEHGFDPDLLNHLELQN